MKKGKKIIIISAIISVILLIVLIIILNMNKKDDNNNQLGNNSEPNIKQPKYTCKLKLEDVEMATTYLIKTFDVKDDRVISISDDIIIYAKTDTYYNTLKELEEYSNGKAFDDKNKTISYSNSDDIDYTKTPDGEEFTLKYSEFVKELEKNNYVCE